MGEGTLTRKTAWREAGRLAYGQTDEGKAQTADQDATLSLKERLYRRSLSKSSICALAYIPDRNTAQWNTQSDKLSCGGTRGRTPRISTCAQSGCRGVATARPEPGPGSQHHARRQQRQRAPAQPYHRSPQMRRGGQRYAQPAANREIGSHAHRALRHQGKHNAGQRPRCRPARAPSVA
jgi:hypothetical protein